MTDLWTCLANAHREGRPIVMYGMGNGADKILAVCEHYGIAVSDFFASDGFVRGHSFHGKTVLSFSDVCEKYGTDNLIVLLSFASSRPEVLSLIESVAARCELYAPDVPVCGEELFDRAFYNAHSDEIAAARSLFADEESRRVYDGIIEYKLTGCIDILRATESSPAAAYRDILHAERFATAADLGAYNGDSIRELRTYAPSLTHAIAMESDRRNYRKLTEYAESLREAGDPLRVWALNEGAWSEPTVLTFHDSGNRNAGVCKAPAAKTASPLPSTADNKFFGKVVEVTVNALDNVIAATVGTDTRIDYVKYDVEGAEREALLGSRNTILRDSPALLVSAYHRSADLFSLPLLVHDLNPNYRLYLRRTAGIPAWDINLYAVV